MKYLLSDPVNPGGVFKGQSIFIRKSEKFQFAAVRVQHYSSV
jgi:hypothetical protein